MKKTNIALGLLVLLGMPQLAAASADGKPLLQPVSCEDSVFSSAGKICDLFKLFGGADVCQVTTNSCVEGTQELFVGNQIELASPTHIKNWTGFGGLGLTYQAANLCLLRDLKDGPITSEAKAQSPIGGISIKQKVQFQSFDRQKMEWVGYHTARACAPAIGCLDVFSQKITAKATNTALQGKGKKAGEYDILSAQGLEVKTDGVVQALNVTIPAISVATPYGMVTAKPRFDLARGVGYILAPFSKNNIRSQITGPWGTAKLTDLYGRDPGTIGTQVYPSYTVTSDRTLDFRTIGWISQAGFGSRSANPKTPVWSPAANDAFPTRPDSDVTQARSNLEKVPNAYLGANVNLSYSPTDLLPESVRNNGFIGINFKVWAQPTLNTGFTSQFNMVNAEIAKGTKLVTNAGPLDYRPQFMDQFKGVQFFAGTTAAVRFALEAGVDLKLHLHVPLPWPLSDINLDLINIHPRTTVAETVKSGTGKGNKSAAVFSQASKIVATKKLFQSYQTFNGPVAAGQQHLQACLAAPNLSQDPPDEPTYEPGHPEDLTENVLYPCNICVGMNDYEYQDEKKKNHKIDGFIQTLFPANQNTRPANKRWACDQVYEAGCYDMCSYNAETDQLTVVETALEMIQAGNTQKMPGRCR